MSLQKKINKLKPTKTQEVEVVDMIKSFIELWRDEFKQGFKENKEFMWRIIIQFHTLPKTDLHKEFDEKILSYSKDEEMKRQSDIMKQRLSENIKKAKQDKRFDWTVGDYMAIRILTLDNGEKIKNIWLEYYEHKKGWKFEQWFWYLESLSSHQHKYLFDLIE